MSVTLAPDDVVRSHADAAANAREPLLVLEPLIEFLDAHGLAAPTNLNKRPMNDKHSNVTFALSKKITLHQPPHKPLPPSTHDILRETRLLSTLKPTPIHTPKILTICNNTTIIKTPFYIIKKI